jgi:hypothetical protein
MWKTRDGLDRVQNLLDEQYELLLSGKVTDMDRAAQALSSLVDKLATGALRVDELQRAKRSAERNQRLLENTIRAIKDVAARVQSAQTAKSGFVSYTPLGSARTVGASHGKTLKKL